MHTASPIYPPPPTPNPGLQKNTEHRIRRRLLWSPVSWLMTLVSPQTGISEADKHARMGKKGGAEHLYRLIHLCVCVCRSCVCVSSLDVLADLPLETMAALLQLFDGAFLGELVRSTAHLSLRHAACEQLLKYHIIYYHVVKATCQQGKKW